MTALFYLPHNIELGERTDKNLPLETAEAGIREDWLDFWDSTGADRPADVVIILTLDQAGQLILDNNDPG